jgi:hypothetical protein
MNASLPAADDVLEHAESDVLYRFGQVAIRERSIDWGSTCGNMVAAAAQFSVTDGLLDNKKGISGLPDVTDIQQASNVEREIEEAGQSRFQMPVRIMAHNTGNVVTAHVPVAPRFMVRRGMYVWRPYELGDTRIAGVPGTAPGIMIETPLAVDKSVLSTGKERDVVEVDGERIEVTVVDTGLPVIFASAESCGISVEELCKEPSAIDANVELMAKLERIRQAASRLTPALTKTFSPPAPKICVIAKATSFTSTGGETVQANDMDIFIRAVSVGQLHRTVPATTLSALAAARCFENSTVSEQIAKHPSAPSHQPYIPEATATAINEALSAATGLQSNRVRAITVGQPAGLSTASILTDEHQRPSSVVMMRTAKRIISGSIDVPYDVDIDTRLQAAIESRNVSE